jgi:hypothetical protein
VPAHRAEPDGEQQQDRAAERERRGERGPVARTDADRHGPGDDGQWRRGRHHHEDDRSDTERTREGTALGFLRADSRAVIRAHVRFSHRPADSDAGHSRGCGRRRSKAVPVRR